MIKSLTLEHFLIFYGFKNGVQGFFRSFFFFFFFTSPLSGVSKHGKLFTFFQGSKWGMQLFFRGFLVFNLVIIYYQVSKTTENQKVYIFKFSLFSYVWLWLSRKHGNPMKMTDFLCFLPRLSKPKLNGRRGESVQAGR